MGRATDAESVHRRCLELCEGSLGAEHPETLTAANNLGGVLKLGWKLPPGKHTKKYGKSPFMIGKTTIPMVIFNSYIKLPEGKSLEIHEETMASGVSCVESGWKGSRLGQGRVGNRAAFCGEKPGVQGLHTGHFPLPWGVSETRS